MEGIGMEQSLSLPTTSRRRPMRILRLTLIVLIVLLVGYLAISAYVAERFTIAERLFTQDTPLTYGMSYEEVTFPAREDGLEIAAWYIPADESQSADQSPAIVMVHGWNASRTYGFNKHFLDLAQALHQSGFSVLMIDLREHGESAPAHTSFGMYERRDVLGAVDYLLARGHQPGQIGLLGTSTGAASVVGAAAEDQAAGAVVTDSLFAESYPVMKVLWRLRSDAPMAIFYSTVGMFRVMNGYDLASAHPIDEIGRIPPRPLLMIHCQGDDHVPVEQFEQLKQAAPWAETWLVQDCRHSEIYEFVPEEYDQKVVAFFEAGLK